MKPPLYKATRYVKGKPETRMFYSDEEMAAANNQIKGWEISRFKGLGEMSLEEAHEAIGEMIDEGMLDKDLHVAIDDYNSAILHGIVKIASKMGISTLQSYQSAQIFEIVGINKECVDKYFTNVLTYIRECVIF